ncbi:MAG: aminoglycoside phosphotransferase family protein [Halioglobus sp.]
MNQLGAGDVAVPPLVAVAGDASARRYFRFSHDSRSYIVAEAPPETEKNTEFVDIAHLLLGAGIRVPGVHALDVGRGFLLLDDLGDQLLLPLLVGTEVDHWYQRAFELLLGFARLGVEQPDALPGCYDSELLTEELGRFPEWFAGALLRCEITAGDVRVIGALDELLIDNALAQPRVLVHRDFHSRNLMVTGADLAVIDFQDAVMGPVTYDLVSLLRDCYIRWPGERVHAWALDYRQRVMAAGLMDAVPEDQFLRWFDLMGLQRHIKVLGTFARLHLRDGKDDYLADLPLVVAYVREVLGAYRESEPVIEQFAAWFEERLVPRIEQQRWSRPA